MLEVKRKLGLLALGACAAMFLSACHDDDDESEAVEKQIELTVAKGAVIGATCEVTDFSGETSYGLATTLPPDGRIAFLLTFFGGIPENSAVLISCANPQVGPPAQYFNEAANELVDLEDGQIIRAIVPSTELTRPAPAFAVTPLTDLAAGALIASAEECGCEPTAGGAEEANQEIADLFGLDDILTPPAVINDDSPTLGDNEAGQYALILAALATAAGGGDPFAYMETIAAAIEAGNTAVLEQMQEDLAEAVVEYVETVDSSGIPDALVEETVQEVEEGDTAVIVDPQHGGS